MTPELSAQLMLAARAFSRGQLVFFLGAGANLCDRNEGWTWRKDQHDQLPSGAELCAHLIDAFDFRQLGLSPSEDLANVAQQIEVVGGTGPLFDELHGIVDADYPLHSLHRLLASLPELRRSRGYPLTSDPTYRRLLFITTNYDDLLERALTAAGEPFHIVTYCAGGPDKGRFVHRSPFGIKTIITGPSSERLFTLDEYPIILKFHGSVDRRDPRQDSFVITEDHYIDYLSRVDVTRTFPKTLLAPLSASHVLFLGHKLRDWNLRVMLYRIWEKRVEKWNWWAVQRNPPRVDREFWRDRKVEILDVSLGEYTAYLAGRLQAGEP